MADRLQPPLNSTLGKRKSDDDLGKQAGERKASKEAEAQMKANWVHRKVRQRSRWYCCQCEDEQGWDKKGACVVCGHGPKGCSECLARRAG